MVEINTALPAIDSPYNNQPFKSILALSNKWVRVGLPFPPLEKQTTRYLPRFCAHLIYKPFSKPEITLGDRLVEVMKRDLW